MTNLIMSAVTAQGGLTSTLLERGDWIAILVVALGGIGILWRALWKQTDASKAMATIVETNTIAHQETTASNNQVVKELAELGQAIRESNLVAERTNKLLIEELFKRLPKL